MKQWKNVIVSWLRRLLMEKNVWHRYRRLCSEQLTELHVYWFPFPLATQWGGC